MNDLMVIVFDDLSSADDLLPVPDLARRADMTSPRDLARRDMTPAPDATLAPDLSTVSDLSPDPADASSSPDQTTVNGSSTSGCGCQVGARTPDSPPALALLVAGLLCVGHRRLRRRIRAVSHRVEPEAR